MNLPLTDILLLFLILNVIFNIGLCFFLFRLFRSYKLRQGKTQPSDEESTKSIDVLKDANYKAQEIINEFVVFSTQSKEQMAEYIKKIYSMDSLTTGSIQGQIKETVENQINQVAQEFKQRLETQIADLDREARIEVGKWKGRFEEVNIKLEKDLTDFKELQKREFASRLSQIIEDVSRDILGSSIDQAKHKELVKQALERGKRDGLF